MEAAKAQREEQLARWKAELDASTKVLTARISANPGVDIQSLENQDRVLNSTMQEINALVSNAVNKMAQMQNDMADMHQNSINHIGSVMQVLKAPKRIVRGPDGRATGVEIVTTEAQ